MNEMSSRLRLGLRFASAHFDISQPPTSVPLERKWARARFFLKQRFDFKFTRPPGSTHFHFPPPRPSTGTASAVSAPTPALIPRPPHRCNPALSAHPRKTLTRSVKARYILIICPTSCISTQAYPQILLKSS
jgi:hypothetical protein